MTIAIFPKKKKHLHVRVPEEVITVLKQNNENISEIVIKSLFQNIVERYLTDYINIVTHKKDSENNIYG